MPSTPSPYPLRAHELSHHGHKGTHLVSMEATAAAMVVVAVRVDSGEAVAAAMAIG